MSPSNAPSGRDVFEILVREHADMLAAYLRSLMWTPSEVDDLFQETMLVAWRRLPDYDRSLPFGPWLRGIAQKLVLEHHRRGKGLAACIDPATLAELDRRYDDLSRTPGDTFRAKAERVLKCLTRLPEPMRAAIEMVYLRDMLMAAAASALDATEEAIKKRVQRARQLLSECVRSAENPA